MSKIMLQEGSVTAVEESDAASVVARAPAPVSAVAAGLSLAPLSEADIHAGSWARARDLEGALPPELKLSHLTGRPGVWALTALQEMTVKAPTGAATLWDDTVVFDGGRAQVVAELSIADADYVAIIDREFLVLRHTPPSTALEQAVEASLAWTAVDLPAPPLSSITGEFTVARWMEEAFERLAATPSCFERTAAVGLVARLWNAEGTSTRVALLALQTGKPTPAINARRWFEGLSAAARRSVVLELGAAVQSWLDGLGELRETLAAGRSADAAALDLLHRRDDLASAAALTGGDPALGQGTMELLRQLDAEASLQHAVWSDVTLAADARLEAVRATDPDAWWGALLR